MRRELQTIFDKHFKFLVDEFGYQVVHSTYEPHAFGNFVIELAKGTRKLKLISDRSQIFIELFEPDTGWMDKEKILEANGILRSRFGSTYDLWNGFEIQNQSADLKKNSLILNL